MILFDFSYYMNRIVHPNKLSILENTHFYAHLITSQVLKFSKQFGASKQNKFVICLDSPSWRKEYYINNKPKCPLYEDQTYKGKRKKDMEIPWDAIYEINTVVTNSFKDNSDFYVMNVPGAEADDIIAVLADTFKTQETIFVLSPDKDFVQLQDVNVYVYDQIKGCYKVEQDIELYKTIHFIIGDTSDNILAIKPSTKDKTAIKMLKDLPTLLATNPLMREKYQFNKKLIDFAEIPAIVKEDILKEFETQKFSFNATGLLKTFMKYQMSKHSEDIASFRLSDKEVKTTLNQHFITAQKNQELSTNNLEEFFS